MFLANSKYSVLLGGKIMCCSTDYKSSVHLGGKIKILGCKARSGKANDKSRVKKKSRTKDYKEVAPLGNRLLCCILPVLAYLAIRVCFS